jgi:hypothetical protein
MSQHQQWITLDSCIYDYISEAELSQNKYFKLFHLGFRCMEDLGLDFFYQIKSIKIPINANKTITLPADFLQYTKFGILNSLGELVPLKYNEKLTTFNDLHAGRIADTSSSNFVNYYSFSSPIFFNFWNGSWYENFYGVPGGYIYAGGFKIDIHNGVILLDSAFNWSNSVLEYVASPQEGQDYYIPVQFRETMIAWLAWKDIANTASRSHMNLGDKRDRRHEYFEAKRKGIAQYRPFYLDQAYISNLETSRLVVKA